MAEPMDDFSLEDDLPPGDDEESGEPEEVAATPVPMAMTPEQMQTMLDRQAAQFAETQKQNLTLMQQALTPKQETTLVEPPDPAELLKAIQEGDADAYLKLTQQKDMASEQRHQLQLQRLEAGALQRFNEVNKSLLDSAVPGYTEHKGEVDKQMDELNLSPDLRTNPKIVEILTRAARGSEENFEKEIKQRQESQRRKANDIQPGDVTTTTPRRSTGRAQPEESVFSPDGLQAFASAGKDPDEFARKMGYADMAAYETSTRELRGETVTTHKFLKGREAEFK